MKRGGIIVPACFAAIGLAAVAGSLAQPAKDGKAPTGQPEMQLPPGWTAADMQACAEAAIPGPMHDFLAKGVGVWKGQNKMWMAPGTDPIPSECTSTVTSMLDGRFVKCELSGDMPGMGPFNGFGIAGYDNVSQKFQQTWVDNCGTGMMVGTGTLSSDQQTLTWEFTYTCPITKKPTKMREIERITGTNTKTLEMHTIEPKSGKEYKMMEITFTRSGA